MRRYWTTGWDSLGAGYSTLIAAPSGSATPPFNTISSFTSNTNLQHYSGETGLSYFSQMCAVTFLQFVTAATGIAACVALMRALAGNRMNTIGNFYVDLTRANVRVLLPLAVVVALVLMWQGSPMTFEGAAKATTIEGAEQTVARGVTAPMVAIKQLGTNGGGFFAGAVLGRRDDFEILILELLVDRLPPGQVLGAPSQRGPGQDQDLLAAEFGEPDELALAVDGAPPAVGHQVAAPCLVDALPDAAQLQGGLGHLGVVQEAEAEHGPPDVEGPAVAVLHAEAEAVGAHRARPHLQAHLHRPREVGALGHHLPHGPLGVGGRGREVGEQGGRPEYDRGQPHLHPREAAEADNKCPNRSSPFAISPGPITSARSTSAGSASRT